MEIYDRITNNKNNKAISFSLSDGLELNFSRNIKKGKRKILYT